VLFYIFHYLAILATTVINACLFACIIDIRTCVICLRAIVPLNVRRVSARFLGVSCIVLVRQVLDVCIIYYGTCGTDVTVILA